MSTKTILHASNPSEKPGRKSSELGHGSFPDVVKDNRPLGFCLRRTLFWCTRLDQREQRLPFRIQTALLFLIAAPLAMLGWIGIALIRDEELSAKQQVVAVSEGRLLELIRSVDDTMSSRHRHIKQQLDLEAKLPDHLMLVERTDPHVRRTMWVSVRGKLLYPTAPTSNADKEFLLHNELLLMARQRPVVPTPIRKELRDSLTREPTQMEVIDQQASKSDSQWQESYFDEGLQLVVWSVRPDGSAIGCWLERARWISDIIAILPDIEPSTSDGATALLDANGDIVYRWGAMEVPMETPLAEAALKEPLASWRLRYYLPIDRTSTSLWIRYWRWGLVISAVATALLALGAYVGFATTQQLRLANQRVSFVGQVSHELRTPLTNIRLYAEMAKRDLAHDKPSVLRIADRLEVIDSESKRLSRLISGVLEFIQGRSKAQTLVWRSVVPDEIIRQVLKQCTLSLDRSGILVTCDLNADRHVEIDSDVLEQILINLISNVEKYAASGGTVHVSSGMDNQTLTVEVHDSGPGIATRYLNRIFQPFFRLDDSITAPSGTGLGLTIARAAAKRHGGGLELLQSECGAHFRLWLRIRTDDSSHQEADS